LSPTSSCTSSPPQNLGFDFQPTAVETDLTHATAHRELQDLCLGVPAAALRSIRWPSLAAFFRGWLRCAETHSRSPSSSSSSDEAMVYLMQAERLCNANDVVDELWCEEVLGSPGRVGLARALLRGREGRRRMSTWT
jgi:hypothetical protein